MSNNMAIDLLINRTLISGMLRNIRSVLELTLKALANVLGVSEATIIRWEKGTVVVEELQIKKIKWLNFVAKYIDDRVDKAAIKHILEHCSAEIFVLLCYNSKVIPGLPEGFDDHTKFLANFYSGFQSNRLLMPDLLRKVINLADDGISEIKDYIADHKAAINNSDFNRNTALHIAAAKKNFSALRLLVQNGANVNLKNYHNETALHFVLHESKIKQNLLYEIINLLIENGADVNAVDIIGQTPLFLAAHNFDSASIVELLIQSGADIDYFPENGIRCSSVMAALIKNHTKVAKCLIEKNAKLDFKDQNGLTAIHYAVIRNNTEIVKLLQKMDKFKINLEELQKEETFNIDEYETIQDESLLQFLPIIGDIRRMYFGGGPKLRKKPKK